MLFSSTSGGYDMCKNVYFKFRPPFRILLMKQIGVYIVTPFIRIVTYEHTVFKIRSSTL